MVCVAPVICIAHVDRYMHQAHSTVTFVTKKWKISLLNGYCQLWCKHAINKFLIDNSASCWSQDIQVFEN